MRPSKSKRIGGATIRRLSTPSARFEFQAIRIADHLHRAGTYPRHADRAIGFG
jgi:hypothetical protein